MTKPRTKPKRRARGEGGLYKRPDGVWAGVLDMPSADGKRRQKWVYSRDYNTAVQKLRELRDKRDAGAIATTPHTTVGAWLDYWLRSVKAQHIRPNTRQFYDEAIRLHIIPAPVDRTTVGKIRLDKLTPQNVRDMLAGIDTGRNRQRAHQVLSLALKAAVKDGILTRNVCEAVSKPRHLPARRGALDADTAKRIIKTAIDLEASRDEKAPRLATRWAAAFFTGARKAELLGLEWERVDLENGVMDLSWQLQELEKAHGCGEPVTSDAGVNSYPCGRQRPGYCPEAKWNFEDGFEYRECHRSLVWTRPKSSAGTRVVPLAVPLLEMLRLDGHHNEPNPHNLVWHHHDGRPIGPHDDHHYWRELLKATGVEHVPLHTARHTANTLLQSLGVDEPTRMLIVGQSSVAAQRAYLHVDLTQRKAAVARLGELLI